MVHAVSLNTTGMINGAGQAAASTRSVALQATNPSPEHRPEPLVSVIIPCYNNGKYIEECVRSVLKQTYTNFEIIIINDASTDDSAQKIKKLQEENPQKIQVITNRKNCNRSISRNIGMHRSKGELICFLDSDDRWYPSKLANQVRAMQDDPKLAFCGTGMDLINENSDPKHTGLHICRSGEIFLHLLARRCLINTSSVMLRRSVVDKVGNFSHSKIPAEDYDYWVRASFLGRYKHIPEELVSYRIHEAQSTSPSNLNVNKVNQIHTSILEENTQPKKLREYIGRVRKRGGFHSQSHIYLKPGCSLKNRINLFSQNLFSKFNPNEITRENINQLRHKILSLEYLKQAEYHLKAKQYDLAHKALIRSKNLDRIRLIDPNWIDCRIRCKSQAKKKTLPKPSFQFFSLSRAKT
jgi:glycosyltransferase involved in cell wall biosynthesis